MPELPEVETVVRRLRPALAGRTLQVLRIFDPLLRDSRPPRGIRGARVVEVARCGKEVAIGLVPNGGPPVWLLVHLRMTGRLLWYNGTLRGRASRSRPHVRARFHFERGVLEFVDTRRFGTVRWLVQGRKPRASGVDPLSRNFTPARLGELLAGSRQPLKAWLMRQDRLAGLGNIYASEVLFEARLHPLREGGSLCGKEIAELHGAIRRVLRRAIRHCGTTFSDFQDPAGRDGRFQRLLAVYGRDGQPCPRCGAKVRRIVIQQRSTFVCPHCQPHPEPPRCRTRRR